jgi:hypothetical protein
MLLLPLMHTAHKKWVAELGKRFDKHHGSKLGHDTEILKKGDKARKREREREILSLTHTNANTQQRLEDERKKAQEAVDAKKFKAEQELQRAKQALDMAAQEQEKLKREREDLMRQITAFQEQQRKAASGYVCNVGNTRLCICE